MLAYANPNYINPSAEHRQYNMDRLIELAKTLELPINWKLIVSAASLRFENSSNTKSVKIDSTCVLTLDITYMGKVKSSTFPCKNVEAVWTMVSQTMKAYLGARQ
jgi:hypothetical protein